MVVIDGNWLSNSEMKNRSASKLLIISDFMQILLKFADFQRGFVSDSSAVVIKKVAKPEQKRKIFYNLIEVT